MEDVIVYLAIERISYLLIHEADFLSGVKDEVESLKAELKRMLSFLKDADRMPEQDNRLRNRVSEIRALAYDAEDVIDSFILKLAHQGGFQGAVRRTTSIFTKPIQLHKIGVRVKDIQTKLKIISESLPAYAIPGEELGSTSIFRWQQRLRRTFSHVEEEDVVSLEVSTKDVLAQLMTEEERLAVVSIVGMGGIGKTTLARKVYNHVDVRRHFDCLAWISISEQWNPREVLLGVLKVFSPSRDERKLTEKEREDELIKRLFNVLREKRYLIVLDDIWSGEDWDILKHAFPRGREGSKILITTRDLNVALDADLYNYKMELPFLTHDESWNLLSMKAFPRNKTDSHYCSEEFEKLGRDMAARCGGLPLAIVVLGGLLATKKSRPLWEMVQRNIEKGFQQRDDVFDVLNIIFVLSYNDLPYYLKPCFLYLGHYPKDWEISKKELIRLWIAEGFISPSLECKEMLMEDVGEQFLEELMDRSLVQVGRRDDIGTNVKTCRIHDILRDLCIKKSTEENFLEIIHPSCIGNDGDSVDVILPKRMLRRIAIHPSSKRIVRLKGEHPKLRSLLLFENEELIKFQISKRKSLEFLRVLKLVRKDVEKWHVSNEIGNLHHLRYLKLNGKNEIILPESIGRLKSLYYLYVVCEYCVVPNVIFKLERLCHISLKDTARSRGWMCSSKYIQTLKNILVEEKFVANGAAVRMSNIQSLGLVFKRTEDVKGVLMSLIELHHLASLSMDFSKFSVRTSFKDLEPLSQCHGLSKLKLRGRIEEDPKGSHHALKFLPPNIVNLTLVYSGIKQDPMGVLEKLPCLRILKLGPYSYSGSKMICLANGFPKLDSLEMSLLEELEEWEIEEGAMPSLRNLSLRTIPMLMMLPGGLRDIITLQEMKLTDMNSSLTEKVKARDEDGREGENFYKVRHIPSLIIQNYSLRPERYRDDDNQAVSPQFSPRIVKQDQDESRQTKPSSSKDVTQQFSSSSSLNVSTEMPTDLPSLRPERDGNDDDQTVSPQFSPRIVQQDKDDTQTRSSSSEDGSQQFSSSATASLNNSTEMPTDLHSPSIEKSGSDDNQTVPPQVSTSLVQQDQDDTQTTPSSSEDDTLRIERYSLSTLPKEIQEKSSLQHLYLIDCIPLKIFPSCPSLKTLYIHNCKSLEFPPPNKLMNQLEDLCLGSSCDSLETFPLNYFPKLKSLSLWGCINLDSLSVDKELQAELTSLDSMEIKDCPKLRSFLEEVQAPNLTSLVFFNCGNLKSLQSIQSFKSLQSLYINKCPALESFPMEGLPSGLIILCISFCDKITPQKGWNLDKLHSLSHFEIEGGCLTLKSFPEEGLLPTNLKTLRISDLLNLTSLDGDGLQKLPSLQTLEINSCNKLDSLPEHRLPSSLSSLSITDCSLLNAKLRKRKGKEWLKIAHIPFIHLDEDSD